MPLLNFIYCFILSVGEAGAVESELIVAKYLCIALGGAAGALLRWTTSRAVNATARPAGMALGTLAVNCAGALLIGFFSALFDAHPAAEKLKLFTITGFLGGLTTFSAYSLETAQYLSQGRFVHAGASLVLNNVVCILFVFTGMWLSKRIL